MSPLVAPPPAARGPGADPGPDRVGVADRAGDRARGGDAPRAADPAERRIEKLLRINAALMARVERAAGIEARGDGEPGAYALFERAAMLEAEVRARTRDLDRAIDLLNESNARLETARRETEAAIEAIQEGFALFDARDRLILRNARFGRDLPDIRPHLVPGLAFDDYVTLVSRSAHLALGDEAPEAWGRRRRESHLRGHAAFNVPLAGGRWLQVSERRTASDGTVILQTDVTDIVRGERAERDRLLGDQARVMRATLDHLAQGVCIFDAESRLIGSNRSLGALLSLPTTALRPGTGLDRLLDAVAERAEAGPEAPAAGLDALRAWAAGGPGGGPGAPGGPIEVEMRLAGRALRLHARAMPMGFVVSVSEVTAERDALRIVRQANETLEGRVRDRTIELEDALAVAERALATRSRFVAAASHDLLQPLSAAKLYLGSLEFDEADPRAAAATKAGRAMESVEAMLDALLHISRLDAGRHELHVQEVALGPILRRLHDEFAPSAEGRGIALRVVPTRAVPLSDPTYLRRILQNLIANAVRYTVTGRVLVGVRRMGAATIRLDVIDTGPGIAEADLGTVFEEFRRLAPGGPGCAEEGMGLGLAIVERACGLLGHPLEVASEVGRGSRFSVVLPLADRIVGSARTAGGARIAAPGPPGPSGASGSSSLSPPRPRPPPLLLVVAADAAVRGRAADRVEALGFDAIEAASPAAAEALLAQLGVAPDAALVADPAALDETARRFPALPCGPLPDRPVREAIDALAASAPASSSPA